MPTCPVCGSSLSYVEHVIVRNEYTLPSLEMETVGLTEKPMLFPVYSEESKESLVMEVLERAVQCSSINCRYYVDEGDLGEALPSGIV